MIAPDLQLFLLTISGSEIDAGSLKPSSRLISILGSRPSTQEFEGIFGFANLRNGNLVLRSRRISCRQGIHALFVEPFRALALPTAFGFDGSSLLERMLSLGNQLFAGSTHRVP